MNWTGLPSLPESLSSLIVTQTASHSKEDHLVPFEEECIAHVTHTMADDGHAPTQLMCTLNNGMSFRIPSIGEPWIKQQMILGQLISDETIMTLPADTMLDQNTHEIYTTEPPILRNHEMEERERRRRLRRLATIGTKTVLVVLVKATDKTSTLTETEIGDYVFGNNGGLNPVSQTAACSYNQLTFNKASNRAGATTSISNGVVTVSISVATSAGELAVTNAITTALQTEFSVTSVQDLADHTMYCYPTGTMVGIARATVGGFLSYYNDKACSYPSAVIHEIG
jgi:hypothetical protein